MNLPVPVIFLAFIAILLMMEHNRRKRSGDSHRIETLEARLEVMKLELTGLEKLKSDILSRIGVSLRKPLESVRTTAAELTRPLDGIPEVRDQLARLASEIEEIENFLEVIREIAYLGKMDRSGGSPLMTGPESEVVSLDQLLLETLDEWNDRFSDSGISMAVSSDEDVRVIGSRRYLKQAIENVLSEMSRAAMTGGMVHIVLSSQDGAVRLSVDYRGELALRESRSALGVELARQILSAHEGWLSGDPEAGRYAVELPLAGSDGAA